MECNKDEAVRAKDIAQRKMINNDFEGGRKFGLKAQKLFPELENISQMLAVCDVHCAANREMNGGAKDLYGILQVERSADVATIKKQYRKLAFVLHPDKNHFPGAESAFKLVGEANMILSDNGKRSLYDYTCRDPANSTILKQQNPQGNQSSQSGDQNKYPNGHQKSHSDSKVQPSFWTFCPFCKRNYQYYRDLVNKRIKCPKCLKFFIAIDIGACKSKQSPHTGHDGVQNVKLGTTSLQHEEVGKQKKAKVDPQRAEPSVSHTGYQPPQSTKHGDAKVDPQRAELSFSHPAYQPQFSKNGDAEVGGSCRGRNVENGDIKTKGGKEGAANKGTGRMSDSDRKNVGSSKQSHKRSHVSNSEEAVADFGPEKRYRLRKSSSDIKDKQKEIPADAELNKENNKSDSDSEHDSEPVYVDVLDLEFSNFDKDKEEHCFAVDQIWAIYDTIDSMPRFYAQIRKVYSSGFRLRIAWLEADPEDPLERNWAEKGLPVACGKFKHGDSEVTKDRLMFSHQMAFEKGSKRFSFVIYPKKGEIWALFKDWDITKWSSDPKNHMKFKFEIVEILSDFDKENGVLVAYMVKVEGFVSLFQKSSRAQLAECRVPSSDLFRFSHHIPSLKLTGNERAGVPVGSCELDTASLPDDLDQFYFSKNVKAKPGNVSSAKKSASSHQSPKKKVKKDNLNQSTGVQNKSNFATSEKGSGPSCQDDDVNISSTKLTKSHSPDDKGSKMIIHNFSLDKQNWVFEEGQIWALGRSNNVNLRCYAQIKKIEPTPLRLYVDLLELCSDTVRPFACGIYKASTGGRQIFQRDSFLYLVKAEVNGRNRFNIFPRKNEIWVLCKKQNAECTFDDADAGDCDIVEVVESDGDIIKVLPLTRVGGYQSVFKGVHKVVEVSIDESHRFFYQVPAVHLTDEEDGRLRGFWELDLAEFPGLVLS